MANKKATYHRLVIILGDCLFPEHQELGLDEQSVIFMAEDAGLCQHFKYHKHKLILFLSAMRQHASALSKDHQVVYHKLAATNFEKSYEDKLNDLLADYPHIEKIITYEIEDQFFKDRIEQWARAKDLSIDYRPGSKFYFNQDDFKAYLKDNKRPFLNNYYIRQRKQTGVLMTKHGEPENGQWNFDHDNRKKLPKKIAIPKPAPKKWSDTDKEVADLVNELFSDHPGEVRDFAYATSREEALQAMHLFFEERFEKFGPYEDAIEAQETFLFHSVLSPYLNMGLLSAKELVEQALQFYHQKEVHFPSVEGFIRQVMGWREFMRGMYHNYDMKGNYFQHERHLKDCWYDGSTGLAPVDDSIKKALKHGYTHHIERLMVLGNTMLMCGIHPDQVYKWFMEMYVDSADWVMEPNVYGMSQFADGGSFATKPYIAGSNYIRKMSHYPKGDWCDVMDGLYWRFIDKHRETFAKNQRMSMMLATLRKMNPEKKERIFSAAEAWINKVSFTP
jgi:deoxyribodipyrimidine photolyase-related protein